MNYIFADEAGCLTFSRAHGASRYFIICTVHLEDCALGTQVLNLRRQLAWEGHQLEADQFHACRDPEPVRDRMFGLLAGSRFRIDATLLEKRKARPSIRPTPHRFYQYAWYYHLKHVGPQIIPRNAEVLIHAASLGEKAKRRVFLEAINDVAQQVLPTMQWRASFWSAPSDPCIQIADYCAWAIQRSYEHDRHVRIEQIRPNLRSCYDLFARSDVTYY